MRPSAPALVEGGASTVVVGDLLEQARNTLGPETVLEINRDMLEKLICPKCATGTRFKMAQTGEGKKTRVCLKCKEMIDG